MKSVKPIIRRRLIRQEKAVDENNETDRTNDEFIVERRHKKVFSEINKWVGICVGIILAVKLAQFPANLHENLLWFSNIQEIEREISFRTEQGLYYSYFKQILNRAGIIEGVRALQRDNTTEHGRSVNILQRFNVFQEIALAASYRMFSVQTSPSVFYVAAVFKLQALAYASIYASSWLLGGTWTSGLLTLALFACNFDDATRVHHTTPLREHFSLPFVFAQMAAVTFFFRSDVPRHRLVATVLVIFVTTFLYTLTWQFAQFISLMQVSVILALAYVNQLDVHKAVVVIANHFACLVAVCFLQFGNSMILGSPVLSLAPVGVVALLAQPRVRTASIAGNAVRAAVQSVSTFAIATILNLSIKKYAVDVESDEHILKFVKAKLGMEDPRDFESRLYLCIDSFKPLEIDTYQRLTDSYLLPIYVLSLFIYLATIVYRVLDGWDSPSVPIQSARSALHYNTVHSVVFATLAASTTRMKCLWVPHACVMASVGVSDGWILKFIQRFSSVRQMVVVAFVAFLTCRYYPKLAERLDGLHEFWDPETVELMEWIGNSTEPGSVFAGSMQLLASVKLCTGRAITNHPHFEDKWLRHRTEQVYKVYSRAEVDEVHGILKFDIGADYVVLENGICFAQSDGSCKLIDILDMKDGLVPEYGSAVPGLRKSATPRFCREIQNPEANHSRYFSSVFSNRYFHVFRVL